MFLLSRWTCGAKTEHSVVNFIPELRLSCLEVCVEVTKPETWFVLVHLGFLLKHDLKISSSLQLDLPQMGCKNWSKVPLGTQPTWPTALKHFAQRLVHLKCMKESAGGICWLEKNSVSRAK